MIYTPVAPLEGLPCFMFLFVLTQLYSLEWSPKLNSLVCPKKDVPLDGAPFIVGVITILKQFHSSHTHTFLSYLGQFIRASICVQASNKSLTAIPPHVMTVLVFLEEFCKFSHMPRQAIEAIVPPYIFDAYER